MVRSRQKTAKNSASAPGANAARGVQFLKVHGQHILRNPLIINTMIERAGVKPTDTVLEIGPGTGNLTAKLLSAAGKVIALEVDRRMVAELQKRFAGTEHFRKLEVMTGDAIRITFPYFDVCVANTPYAISSPLVLKLLRQTAPFRCAVLMFQREFAMRLVAKPGDALYGRLAANVQLIANCSHIIKVSPNSFRPPPKVDSSVVRIEKKVPAPDVDFDEWDGLTRVIFGSRSKTLGAIFSQKSVRAGLYNIYCAGANVRSEATMPMDNFLELINDALDTPVVGEYVGAVVASATPAASKSDLAAPIDAPPAAKRPRSSAKAVTAKESLPGFSPSQQTNKKREAFREALLSSAIGCAFGPAATAGGSPADAAFLAATRAAKEPVPSDAKENGRSEDAQPARSLAAPLLVRHSKRSSTAHSAVDSSEADLPSGDTAQSRKKRKAAKHVESSDARDALSDGGPWYDPQDAHDFGSADADSAVEEDEGGDVGAAKSARNTVRALRPRHMSQTDIALTLLSFAKRGIRFFK